MSTTESGFESKIIRDDDACRAVARDYGGYVSRVPQGVIRATRVDDVVTAVRSATAEGVKLTARGAAHSTNGQSQVESGVVLDLRGLNSVLELTSNSVLVQAGALWRDVAQAALEIGRTFPVFTDYLGATVGGTLSAGGVGSRTWQLGTQTDHVLELDVVTAAGDVVRCSPRERTDLFDAVRCGLGQFGVIVSARLRLVEAPQHAHYHHALYGDLATFLETLHAHVDAAEYNCIQGFALGNDPQSITAHLGPAAAAFEAPSDTGRWLFCIETVKLLDTDTELAATTPQRRDWLPAGHFAVDMAYLDYVDRLGPVEDLLTSLGLWQLPHPMVDLILPGSLTRAFLTALLDSVDPDEVAGPVLVYPYERDRLQTPLLRAPSEPRVTLVGLMRTTVPPTPEHVANQLADNRRLYEMAVALGGCYYPVDSLSMEPDDWKKQFGDQWDIFVEAKHRFDPLHLLNPGQSIF
jgi:cytokinin dehydrogenase